MRRPLTGRRVVDFLIIGFLHDNEELPLLLDRQPAPSSVLQAVREAVCVGCFGSNERSDRNAGHPEDYCTSAPRNGSVAR